MNGLDVLNRSQISHQVTRHNVCRSNPNGRHPRMGILDCVTHLNELQQNLVVQSLPTQRRRKVDVDDVAIHLWFLQRFHPVSRIKVVVTIVRLIRSYNGMTPLCCNWAQIWASLLNNIFDSGLNS